MGDVQYHIRCKPGDVGEVVLLPGDPGRVEPIARLLDRPRLIARNRRQGGSARLGAAVPESDNADPATGAFFSEVVRLWARCSFP